MNNYKLESPIVTVLMPSFNEPLRFISKTIESVLNQTYRNFEFIIVDDSTDPITINCIDEYAKNDSRIKVVRKSNKKGVSGARNIGIKEAKGEFIMNIDADDVCYPDRIENQLKGFISDDIQAVGGNLIVIDEFDNITYTPKPLSPSWSDIRKHLNEGIVDMYQPASMIRKSALLNVGCYEELFNCSEDFDLWYKIAINYKWNIVPQCVIKYRVHGNNAHLKMNDLQARLCCIVLIKYSLKIDRCLTQDEYYTLLRIIQSNLYCRLYIYVRCIKNRLLSKVLGILNISNLLAKIIINTPKYIEL